MRKRFNIVFALLFLSLMLISCGDGGSGGGGGGGSGIQENDGDIINTDSIRMESLQPKIRVQSLPALQIMGIIQLIPDKILSS